MSKKVPKPKTKINTLKDQFDVAELYSRRNCVVIHSIDSNKDENTKVTARNFFSMYLDFDIKQEEIDHSCSVCE